jgi:hypothetical protein
MSDTADGRLPFMLMASLSDHFPNHDVKQIRAMVVGLVFECPLGGNPDDCMCHAVREMPAGERFEWVNQLSDDDCLELYRKHSLCLEKKVCCGQK